MIKNPPANEGNTGSIPGPGRSHMPQSDQVCEPQLLNLSSRAVDLQLLKPTHPRARAPQEKLPQCEAQSLQLESSPYSPKPDKSPCSNEDPAKTKYINTVIKIHIKNKLNINIAKTKYINTVIKIHIKNIAKIIKI